MANEVHFIGLPGSTHYAVVHSSGQVWRPASSAFENYNAANWANYATAVALTEQGASGYFVGSFPAIGVAGEYKVAVYRQGGGSPAVGDQGVGGGVLKWSGSAEIPLGDANVITIANDAITAAAIATDAIGASEVSAGAVTKIQDGLATAVNQTTILNRIGAFTGSGINTILGLLRALGRKDAALTPTDMGGTYDNTTDSLEAQRDAGSGATPESIAEAVRTELEPELDLINTNLDAKISDIIGGPTQTVVVGGGPDCAEVQYFDQGEKKPVGASLAATGGTFTISTVTVSLVTVEVDSLGEETRTVVYGINNVNATGFDVGGLTAPRAWYRLDTVTPPSGGPIAIGNYEMIFTFVGTSSDTIARSIDIPIVISVS